MQTKQLLQKKDLLKPELFKGFYLKKEDLSDLDFDFTSPYSETSLCVYFNKRGTNSRIQLNGSAISCGVVQLSGIQFLQALITSKKIPATLAAESLKRMIKELKEKIPCAFIMVSNTTQLKYSVINTILNDLSVSYSTEEENPNSGNKIKVWTL